MSNGEMALALGDFLKHAQQRYTTKEGSELWFYNGTGYTVHEVAKFYIKNMEQQEKKSVKDIFLRRGLDRILDAVRSSSV